MYILTDLLHRQHQLKWSVYTYLHELCKYETN